MTRRVGILGGTFDPVHFGHLDLAAAAARALELSSVILMPAHVPPHRPAPIASAFHRFAMVALGIADQACWRVSDLELLDTTRSFTSNTLDRLHAEGYAADELFFLIGADAFRDIRSWKDYPEILDKANFAVVARPGFSLQEMSDALPEVRSRIGANSDGPTVVLIDAPTADVSATAIRQRLLHGDSIDGMVPPAVAQHIARHQLYAAAATPRSRGSEWSNPAAGRLHGQG